MPRFSAGLNKTATTAGATPLMVLNPPPSSTLYLRHLTIAIGSGTASTTDAIIGVTYAATLGTPNVFAPIFRNDPQAAAAASTVATGWSTLPTIGGTPAWCRIFNLGGFGATFRGATWTLDGPTTDVIMRSGAATTERLIIWNVAAGVIPPLTLSVSWDET